MKQSQTNHATTTELRAIAYVSRHFLDNKGQLVCQKYLSRTLTCLYWTPLWNYAL